MMTVVIITMAYHIITDCRKLRGKDPTSKGCNGLYILNAMVSEYEICVAEERVGVLVSVAGMSMMRLILHHGYVPTGEWKTNCTGILM